jgi:hypothetical protein
MTFKGDQMILESDHHGRISCHRLVFLSPAIYTKHYVHISKYNRYSHNYQSNVYHIEYNLVQQNASANSRIDEYSKNKATYIKFKKLTSCTNHIINIYIYIKDYLSPKKCRSKKNIR